MNKDIEMLDDSDYDFRFEFLGENNLPFVFLETDSLSIKFSDVKEATEVIEDISLYEFANPLSYIIRKELLSVFKSDPVKYNLILSRSDITLNLISGKIYRK